MENEDELRRTREATKTKEDYMDHGRREETMGTRRKPRGTRETRRVPGGRGKALYTPGLGVYKVESD